MGVDFCYKCKCQCFDVNEFAQAYQSDDNLFTDPTEFLENYKTECETGKCMSNEYDFGVSYIIIHKIRSDLIRLTIDYLNNTILEEKNLTMTPHIKLSNTCLKSWLKQDRKSLIPNPLNYTQMQFDYKKNAKIFNNLGIAGVFYFCLHSDCDGSFDHDMIVEIVSWLEKLDEDKFEECHTSEKISKLKDLFVYALEDGGEIVLS